MIYLFSRGDVRDLPKWCEIPDSTQQGNKSGLGRVIALFYRPGGH